MELLPWPSLQDGEVGVTFFRLKSKTSLGSVSFYFILPAILKE
jgi:hypothetical protein